MSLFYQQKGNKEAEVIVFIHGGGFGGWAWKKQLEHFEDYHCIVPDLPEHGKSKGEGKIDIEDSAKRIIELIEAIVPGKKVHVVGHSFGAKVLIEMLRIKPEVIEHAVIASALCRPMFMQNLMFNRVSYKLSVMMMKSKRILKYQARQFKFPDNELKECFINEAKVQTVDMIERIYSQMAKHMAVPKGLDNVEVPTLVIAGEKEPYCMKKSVDDLVKVLPRSKGNIISNAAHNYPWANSEEFNHLIREWISN